jgi:hypothetical protein
MSLQLRIKIESYYVRYATSPTNPFIILKGKSYWQPDDPTYYFAELHFGSDNSALPEDILQHENGIDIAKLYYYISDFPNIIDLLRNEGPLLFVLTDQGRSLANVNGIYTDSERVGEGDGKPLPILYPYPEVPA